MFLPKPNALTIPESIAPIGIGLDACNSGNSCNRQSCDTNGSSGGCADTLGWIGVGVGVVGVGFAAAGI